MCGRYTLNSPLPELLHYFDVVESQVAEWKPRPQIFPTESVPILLVENGKRCLKLLRWGFVPSWSQDSKPAPLINARSESVAEKPSFKQAYRQRRCIVPATTFREWKRKGKIRQPFDIGLSDAPFFGMAGIWERWTHPETRELIDTVAILTTSPNQALAEIHDRMPVILRREDFSRWLNPDALDEELSPLFTPFTAEKMKAEALRDPGQGKTPDLFTTARTNKTSRSD